MEILLAFRNGIAGIPVIIGMVFGYRLIGKWIGVILVLKFQNGGLSKVSYARYWQVFQDRIKMKQKALAKVRASVAYIGNGDPTSRTAFGYLMRELRAKSHTPHLISHPPIMISGRRITTTICAKEWAHADKIK